MVTRICFRLMRTADAAKVVHRNAVEAACDLAARFCMFPLRQLGQTGGGRRVEGGNRAAFAGRRLANLCLW